MSKLIGTECFFCEGILSELNTQDWNAENGACDSCCEKAADSSCVFCGTYCHCDSSYQTYKDNQLD